MPAKNWKDTSIRYNQQNRIIEKFLTDLKATKQATFILESCNVCSASCGVDAVGANYKVTLPKLGDESFVTIADIMFSYLYSFPEGLPQKDNGNGLCENELIENLAFAVNKLTDATAKAVFSTDRKKQINEICDLLSNGNNAVVLSYQDKTTTGHFICFVNYDSSSNTLYYYDSWNGNPRNKNSGRLETMTKEELESVMKLRYLKISK